MFLFTPHPHIPHTDQSCDFNLPQCKYLHVSIFACFVIVFFLNMKHKEYYLNFIIDLGLKYYKNW